MPPSTPSAEPGFDLDPEVVARRRAVAVAGHTGDVATARAALADPAPAVRATALGALGRLADTGLATDTDRPNDTDRPTGNPPSGTCLSTGGPLTDTDLRAAMRDDAPEVRRRAAELAAARPRLAASLVALLADGDHRVSEAACFALGELGPSVRGTESLRQTNAVAALSSVATRHRDPLCREAAVAALGAIGDPDGLAAILSATSDRPAVRRRAVLALAPFEGPEVDAALQAALADRDWQVRQAAEDLSLP